MFDKNYKLLDFAYAQVTSTGAPGYLMSEYTVKEAGYAYLFISNENPTQADVYFDDVKMSYTPSNVIQYNEYYPFGMQTTNSWTRENNAGNNFLANGGTELNNTSQLYDLDYRNYDPILGKMSQVDPMASKYASYTPYNFSFNDPVTFNDRTGADPLYSETTRATFGEVMQGGYFKPHVMDNGIFGRPYGPSGSLSHDEMRGSIYSDAAAVKNGSMSYQAYGNKYASNPTQQDLALFVAAMGGANGGQSVLNLTYGGCFSFNVGLKNYGGNFVVINGQVESLGFSFSLPSNSGGLLSFGKSNIVEVNPGQNYMSALSDWSPENSSLFNDFEVNSIQLMSGAIGLSGDMKYNKNSWIGDNGKVYSNKYNGRWNSAPGLRSQAKQLSAPLRNFGYLGDIMGIVGGINQFRSGETRNAGLNIISASAGFFGPYGAAWSFGWDLGGALTSVPTYTNWRDNTWYPTRQHYLGY